MDKKPVVRKKIQHSLQEKIIHKKTTKKGRYEYTSPCQTKQAIVLKWKINKKSKQKN